MALSLGDDASHQRINNPQAHCVAYPELVLTSVCSIWGFSVGISLYPLNMLRKISEIYEVPFTRNIVKSLLSALVGGVAPTKAAAGAAGLALKFVPGAGTVVALATVPALASATTYAVGRIFVEHFESQGTFLTFRPIAAREKMHEYMDTAPAARADATEEATVAEFTEAEAAEATPASA